MNTRINYNILKTAYIRQGYKFYDSEPYNVNIFGIRSNDPTPDEFNDILGVAYRDKYNQPVVLFFAGTTDPGMTFLAEKMGNQQGTFILKPGQYKSCWKLGYHKGRYEALVQSEFAQFVGWRDNNKDRQLTMKGKLYTDVSGLNCHTTSFSKQIQKVGPYSAGCQVIQDVKEQLIHMAIIKKSLELYGDYVSYTLFEESDI